MHNVKGKKNGTNLHLDDFGAIIVREAQVSGARSFVERKVQQRKTRDEVLDMLGITEDGGLMPYVRSSDAFAS